MFSTVGFSQTDSRMVTNVPVIQRQLPQGEGKTTTPEYGHEAKVNWTTKHIPGQVRTQGQKDGSTGRGGTLWAPLGPPGNTLKACSPLHLNFRPLDFPSGPVWLGLHAPNAGGLASTSGPGIRSHILHIRSGAAKYIKIRSNNNKINLRPTTHPSEGTCGPPK